MGSPAVSVVTPFYNTVEHLEECIQSVLSQTCSDFEYVLLDNCSTDGSTEIAKSYARADDRVRYIRAEDFAGQIPNYNRALRCISPDSRFCKVVQADDWIYPRCLEEMIEMAERHPSVGIVSSYRLKGRNVFHAGLPPDCTFLEGSEAGRRHVLGDLFLLGSPTSLLYRSEVVRDRNPFYEEDRLHADTEAGYAILAEWDLGFVHQVLTFSRVEEDSIQSRREQYDPYHLLDRFLVVTQYADVYLSDREARQIRGEVRRAYYRFLAGEILSVPGGKFWEYHREGLSSTGQDIRWAPLALQFLAYLAERLLNPLDTVRGMIRRLGRGQSV